jgi:hypothetical protein
MLAQRFPGLDLMTRDPDVHLHWLLSWRRAIRARRKLSSTSLGVARPKRIGELCDKRAVTFEFIRAGVMRTRRARLADGHRRAADLLGRFDLTDAADRDIDESLDLVAIAVRP